MADKKTILHVDDNDANRYAVSRSLIRAGFDVTEAVNGKEALEKASANPDLVILDIRLPDINGFEVCRRLKADPKTTRIPVLHLSASAATSNDKAKGLDGGADGYLIRPVDPIELVATINSLLRNRETEDALRESEARFRLMANSIPQLAWMARADGSVFWFNERWYEYTGTTFDEMKDWGWKAVHDPKELDRVLQSWKQALASGEAWDDTFPLRRKDGQLRWHLTQARPLKDAEENIKLWFGTNTDVTEQREVEQLLRQSKAEAESARNAAEQANQLKDEFLATLSHELRTPLNAIVGWAQILQRTAPMDEDMKTGLDTIERNAKLQAQLIEDLLDVSRIISGKLRLDIQRVEMAAVVEEAISSVAPAIAAKNIRLERILNPVGTATWGDSARLQQVVWNLLSNAIKFTDNGGKIQVMLARVDSHLELTVSDTGRGIKAEFLPHVFERFRQADSSTRRAQGGLGLGLAIVRQIVELHGGSASVQSDGENKGATFAVRLPVYAAHADLNAPGSPAFPLLKSPPTHETSNPVLDGVKILVVEDEADSRILLQKLFSQRQATVTATSSVSEALEEIGKAQFDVVISDLGMPHQDGFDFIRQLRALPPDRGGRTPAIALTAFVRQEDRTKVLLAGFHVHVPKPADPAELIATVATLTGRTGAN